MSGVRASINLSPTACEAIEALTLVGDGATWDDIAFYMPHRTNAAITRGINTACRAGRMALATAHQHAPRSGAQALQGWTSMSLDWLPILAHDLGFMLGVLFQLGGIA